MSRGKRCFTATDMGVNMNEILEQVQAFGPIFDGLSGSMEHIITGVLSLMIAGILAMCYQAHQNRKSAKAHALQEKRWQAMMARDAEAKLPPVEVKIYDSVDDMMNIDPCDSFIARKLGQLEQAREDGRL